MWSNKWNGYSSGSIILSSESLIKIRQGKIMDILCQRPGDS